MKSCLKKMLLLGVFAGIPAAASINAEMEGMEAVSRDDGTFLVGGPTYIFDRILGAGGVHSESELWAPEKLRYRLLFNRFSVLPSWDPMEPSIWLKTGNELGDMIYQDFITSKDRPDNRTPILEGGFRSPAFKGFWVTGRMFQDDHFSSRTRALRHGMVDDEFSLFGENYPMFSSGYAGFGFTNASVNASALVGEEYLWVFGESSRWIPVHYKPRVETRVDVANVSATVVYEDAEYQDERKKERGNRKEWNGSVRYRCGKACEGGVFGVAAGLAFRALSDSGTVYTELEGNRVAWPFIELNIRPVKRVKAEAVFGMNDDDWLVQDSVEYLAPTPDGMGVVIGVKNISGTRLNPLADDVEFFDGSEIALSAAGQMNMLQSYVSFADSIQFAGIGGRVSLWAEHGAETFDTTETVSDGDVVYRRGDVARINSWIKGVTGELWLGAWYKEMFSFKALGGFERLDGAEGEIEVTPTEFFVSFSADWLLLKSFRISHSLRYRSDAEWNLRSSDPLVVKGDWFWDATFEQMFPKQQLYLAGTLLHVLGKESIETPNGSRNRMRFVCTVRKMF